MNEKLSEEMTPTKKIATILYKQVIGCLLFAARPDICFDANLLSRYSTNTRKRVVRYLKGTIDKSLIHKRSSDEIIGFYVADWANDVWDRRSTTTMILFYDLFYDNKSAIIYLKTTRIQAERIM